MSSIRISNWAAAEGANPLIPHTAELIVGFVAFSLLFLVLRSKVVPMFEKAFSERTEAIQGGMEKAERAQIEAEKALAQYTTQLNEARGEAAKIREDARVQIRQRKRQQELPLQQLHLLKQNANKQLPHFVMK
jgi:F-type H+-transporting ATPase subunit b